MVQARLVQARGRQVIQMRADLGVLQLETEGRPDGAQPHGHDTYFDYLQGQARMTAKGKRGFALGEEQCQEADREFVQFELFPHLLEFGGFGLLERNPDEAVGTADVGAYVLNRDFTQLAAVLISNAVDQHA